MRHTNNLYDASDESYMLHIHINTIHIHMNTIHIHMNTNESYARVTSHIPTPRHIHTLTPPHTRTHPHTPTHLGQQSGAHELPRGGAGAHAESRCRVCTS